MLRGILVFCVSISAFSGSVSAHEGPHHDLDRLTKLLVAEPGRVEWLIDRPRAYRLDEQFSRSLEGLDRAAALNADVSTISLERGLTFSLMAR